MPGSTMVSIVDFHARMRIADIAVAGRTRWTVYDPVADAFHVNIADPPQIVVVEAGDPVGIRRVVPIAHAGPRGPRRTRSPHSTISAFAAARKEHEPDDAGMLGRAHREERVGMTPRSSDRRHTRQAVGINT